jgi:hypothetical protein
VACPRLGGQGWQSSLGRSQAPCCLHSVHHHHAYDDYCYSSLAFVAAAVAVAAA